jgi:2-amino-4-hydroxy-6-hydroxymethyldihydropteridine diphosphokinase
VVKTVYLSLGSNLGDREQMLQSALDRLNAPDLRILRVSSVYETEPIGFKEQPFFLNLVAEGETDLFPLMLLSRIQKVELQLGRKRSGPRTGKLRSQQPLPDGRGSDNGPRTIDIDILLYGRFVIHSSRLDIPHPRLHERRFVLGPLVELAPDLRHPTLGRTMRELLASLEGQKITLRSPTSWP